MPRGATVAPLAAIARRVGIALAVVLVNWGVVLLERDGYKDAADGHLSTIDALYYTTVTLSTTGYGDIAPVSQGARLVNAFVAHGDTGRVKARRAAQRFDQESQVVLTIRRWRFVPGDATLRPSVNRARFDLYAAIRGHD